MARVNIEDSLYRDNRFTKLIVITGCQYKAIGMVVESWALAQRLWVKHRCIPMDKWPSDLNPLLEVGLAKTMDGGKAIYIAGSKKQFSWLEQRIDAARKGGLSKSPEKTKHLKQNKTTEATTEAKPKQKDSKTEASFSYSYSFSNSKKLNTINHAEKLGKPAPDGTAPVISAYCASFKTRYKTNPVMTPKDINHVKQLIKAVGPERALIMVQVYLQMDNKWFKEKNHDLQTLIGNIPKVFVAMNTGNDPDRKEDPFSFFNKTKEVTV